jgi:hypothetical protein
MKGIMGSNERSNVRRKGGSRQKMEGPLGGRKWMMRDKNLGQSGSF